MIAPCLVHDLLTATVGSLCCLLNTLCMYSLPIMLYSIPLGRRYFLHFSRPPSFSHFTLYTSFTMPNPIPELHCEIRTDIAASVMTDSDSSDTSGTTSPAYRMPDAQTHTSKVRKLAGKFDEKIKHVHKPRWDGYLWSRPEYVEYGYIGKV
jgi:hypothetical protein